MTIHRTNKYARNAYNGDGMEEKRSRKPLEMATEMYQERFLISYVRPFGSLVKPKAVDVHDRFALSATTANERDMNTFET